MNESTFERSPHDKKNPYVMISREMAQDKSVSPKARGVLLYLLSLPDDWKIYHSQLQDGLGVGEDYVNSAMEELLENGYAERTREKVKGMFQPYKYKIHEFKKCLPNRENRPGSSGPENPGLQSTHTSSSKEEEEQKKQQQAAPPAAVFSEKPKEQQNPKVYDCLKDINIPHADKIQISARYAEDVVKNSCIWAMHPETKINKTLAAAIKWACQHRPEIPKNEQDKEKENKSYAMQYEGTRKGEIFITACTKYVEIVYGAGQKAPFVLPYNAKCFMDTFQNMLRKLNFPVIKEIIHV